MACLGIFEDTVDPDQPILTLRKTARVFVINPQGRIGMIHVLGQDEFGLRDHLESCGGGIENGESASQAAVREAREELGAVLTDWIELGWIEDEYHRLQRRNHSTFFVAHCEAGLHPRALTVRERQRMAEPVWLCPEEVERRLNPENNQGIGLLIARRDFCAWQEAVRRHQIS